MILSQNDRQMGHCDRVLSIKENESKYSWKGERLSLELFWVIQNLKVSKDHLFYFKEGSVSKIPTLFPIIKGIYTDVVDIYVVVDDTGLLDDTQTVMYVKDYIKKIFGKFNP